MSAATEPVSDAPRRVHVLRSGAAAGLWAGIGSSVPGVAHAVVAGRGIWEPVRLIATTVGLAGGRSFAPLPVAVGGTIHLGLSAFYGAAYAGAFGVRARQPILHGAAFGVALHVLNLRVVTRLDRFRRIRQETNEPVELLAHLLYGSLLAARLRRAR